MKYYYLPKFKEVFDLNLLSTKYEIDKSFALLKYLSVAEKAVDVRKPTESYEKLDQISLVISENLSSLEVKEEMLLLFPLYYLDVCIVEAIIALRWLRCRIKITN